MSRSALLPALLLLALAAGACGDDPEEPQLVVMVAVDQLRGDLLGRYDEHFTGGIRRLLDGGASFVNTTHDHAETATAPGHTTLATGVYPSRHGIAGNSWDELRDGVWTGVYSVDDPGSPLLADPALEGRSPANIRREGLADWIRAAHPDARVVSLSRKDRAAIPLGGQGRGEVYWLALGDGVEGFTTSVWYRDTLPTWVRQANAELAPGLWEDTVWTSTASEAARAMARPDTLSTEGDGVHTTLPHRAWEEAGLPERDAWGDWLEGTPATDAAVFELAARALDALDLGRRGTVDYLALGLSSADGVGHGYGPRSQEQLDNLLRLDRELGTFMDSLDARVGAGRWVMALSADHGVVDMVEWRRSQGLPGRRPSRADQAAMAEATDGAQGDPTKLAALLETHELVADAIPLEELRGSGEPADSFVTLFRNSHVDGRVTGPVPGGGVVVRFVEGFYGGSRGTGHGSPYHYDRWVPFLLYGPGVSPGVREERASTTDVAPSLARLAGIPVPEDLDGVARTP